MKRLFSLVSNPWLVHTAQFFELCILPTLYVYYNISSVVAMFTITVVIIFACRHLSFAFH